MEELNSRQIQAKNTKENILNATANLLRNKSLEDISIQEICKESNVSVGSFYHHFENKASIIFELYKDMDMHFEKNIINYIDKSKPIDAIVEYLVYQCRHAISVGVDIVKNIYKLQIDNGNDFFLSNDRGFPKGLRTLVNLAYEKNLFKDEVVAENLVNELLIISRGVIYNWAISDGEADIINNVRVISENYLKAFVKS